MPETHDDLPRLGDLDTLLEKTHTGEVQVVFITIAMRGEDRIRNIIRTLSDTTASVYIVPDLFVFQLLHSRWTEIQGLPVVSVFENPFYGIDGVLKRTVDIVVAFVAILLCAIPMMLIAMLIKATSRGPIVFQAESIRTGWQGNSSLEVSYHDGMRGRRCRITGSEKRSSNYLVR